MRNLFFILLISKQNKIILAYQEIVSFVVFNLFNDSVAEIRWLFVSK